MLESVFSIAICRQSGDKWQPKTLFLAIFDPHSSIVLMFLIAACDSPVQWISCPVIINFPCHFNMQVFREVQWLSGSVHDLRYWVAGSSLIESPLLCPSARNFILGLVLVQVQPR